MLEEELFKFKICLIGENAVGKTSLIRRFVTDEFDDKYLKTIGTKTTKKEMKFQSPNNGTRNVSLIIWDIMGDKGFRLLLQEAYFFGAQGIIGMCDITRKNTLIDLHGWMEAAQSVTGKIPTIFLGNKYDLVDKQEVDLNELNDFASRYEKAIAYLSSAKTGFNVELAFRTLSEKILDNLFLSES